MTRQAGGFAGMHHRRPRPSVRSFRSFVFPFVFVPFVVHRSACLVRLTRVAREPFGRSGTYGPSVASGRRSVSCPSVGKARRRRGSAVDDRSRAWPVGRSVGRSFNERTYISDCVTDAPTHDRSMYTRTHHTHAPTNRRPAARARRTDGRAD